MIIPKTLVFSFLIVISIGNQNKPALIVLDLRMKKTNKIINEHYIFFLFQLIFAISKE